MPPKAPTIPPSAHTWPADARGDAPEPRLLRNRHNYCYSNAVLQCLLHEPAFCAWFLDQATQHGSERLDYHEEERDDCVLCNLKDLVARYWRPEAEDSTAQFKDLSTGINRFNQSVRSGLRDMNRIRLRNGETGNTADRHPLTGFVNVGAQIDAWDFLGCLLDLFRQQLLLSDVEEIRGRKSLTTNERRNWRESFRKHAALLEKLFCFDFDRSWTCNDCETVHPGNDTQRIPAVGLDVNITEPREKLTLEEYLVYHIFDEEREIRCGECAGPEKKRTKKRMEAATKMRDVPRTITQAPEILVCRLQRWYGRMMNGKLTTRKVSTKVPFPEELDLSDYVEETIFKDGLRYRCQSVVAQHGSLNAGHYVAAIRGIDEDTDAYVLNDARHADEDEVLKPHDGAFETLLDPMVGKQHFVPYILVYRRIHPTAAPKGRKGKDKGTATKTKGGATKLKGKSPKKDAPKSDDSENADDFEEEKPKKGAAKTKGNSKAPPKGKAAAKSKPAEEDEEIPKLAGKKTKGNAKPKLAGPAHKTAPPSKSQGPQMKKVPAEDKGDKGGMGGTTYKGTMRPTGSATAAKKPPPAKSQPAKNTKTAPAGKGDASSKSQLGFNAPKSRIIASPEPKPPSPPQPRGTKRTRGGDPNPGDEGAAKKAKTGATAPAKNLATKTKTKTKPRSPTPPKAPLTRLRQRKRGQKPVDDDDYVANERKGGRSGITPPRAVVSPALGMKTPSPVGGRATRKRGREEDEDEELEEGEVREDGEEERKTKKKRSKR